MQEIYVIYTPGRTGSHIILESISGVGNTAGGLCDAQCYWYPTNPVAFGEYSRNNNIVIHTHDLMDCVKDLQLSPKDVTLILSYRRDLFAQAMSFFVAQISNEWNGKDYSSKEINPQIVEKQNFLQIINFYKNWPGTITNVSEYKSVVSMYYEELVEQGPAYLAEKLNIELDTTKLGSVQKKSPYHYQDCVSNWQDLHLEYVRLYNNSMETWPSWSKAPSC